MVAIQVTKSALKQRHKRKILKDRKERRGDLNIVIDRKTDLQHKDTGQDHDQGQDLIQGRGQGHQLNRMVKEEVNGEQVIFPFSFKDRNIYLFNAATSNILN